MRAETIAEAVLYAGMVFSSFFVLAMPLRHRENYGHRCAVAYLGTAAMFLLLIGGTGIRLTTPATGATFWLANMAAFGALLASMLYTCAVRWQDGLYGAIWAVLQRYLSSEVLLILEHTYPGIFARNRILELAIWVGTSAAVYFAVYHLVAKKITVNGRYNIGPRQLTSAVILALLFFMLFAIVIQIVDIRQSGYLAPLLVAGQVNCLTIMYMQIDLFRKEVLQKELTTINSLYTRQEENYALAKQNIKLINRKCHELKLQIAALRDKTDDAELKRSLLQAEESVRIYDSVTKTGNKVLDTLLTEKSLHCDAMGIKINCVADGAQLNFISATDLYALFAEAIENAIDAVSAIEDQGRRIIDVQVYRRQSFLVINIVNPLKGQVQMEDGVPVTTKKHTAHAGWGVRAMQSIARKYGGILSTEAKDGMFVLHVVIPLQAGE